MDAQKVDVIIMTIKDKIPEEKVMILRERLLNVDDSKAAYISAMPMKSPITALVLSIIFGHLGVDRFYIGDTGLGVGKLITCGGIYVWQIIDWFFIMKATKEKNFEKLMMALV